MKSLSETNELIFKAKKYSILNSVIVKLTQEQFIVIVVIKLIATKNSWLQ
jgi:hypothetical protein